MFTARQEAKTFAKHAGFPDQDCEEISLVVNELATNLIKHANGGIILFQVIENNYKWHHHVPSDSEFEKAMKELDQALANVGKEI